MYRTNKNKTVKSGFPKWLPFLTGVGSIIDLSGRATPSSLLTARSAVKYHHFFDGIENDFAAIGDDLQGALDKYYELLSDDQQLKVLESLLRDVHETAKLVERDSEINAKGWLQSGENHSESRSASKYKRERQLH